MGANSSSMSDLHSNEYLNRFVGKVAVSPNDPFWNQLLSFTFTPPRTCADCRLLEESVQSLLQTFLTNNLYTGNYRSLVHVFITRATELKASAQCENNIFTWQTFNAMFILRSVTKYFIQTVTEDNLVKQFQSNPQDDSGEKQQVDNASHALEKLLNVLVEIIVDVPILSSGWSLFGNGFVSSTETKFTKGSDSRIVIFFPRGPEKADGLRAPPTRCMLDLSVLEEVLRMVLEILNSCLTHQLGHNPNLIYTLLYKRHVFEAFRTHPTFQDIIQNLETVLTYFSARLDAVDANLTVSEVYEVIQEASLQWPRDKLKKFPELKFKYVEEEQPEEFFIPYVWSLVYHYSDLYWNTHNIILFNPHKGT
ncbi:dymeclin-like [Limulus polyphemus]|uniref:Dymeclin n=1 Tax=Limulus polyphemus TaxID=6850 RepID=A0ABM1B2B5_LIMPO|nr:dymeclin-like [Limulus polyphemus]